MLAQSKKILIIEDDKILARLLSESLKKESFVVLSASDGEKGLTMALENHPDLILLDIMLPKMDGLTLLKKLREDAWGKEASVIILSNTSDSGKVSEALRSGTYDFLVKTDLKLEEVLTTIKEKLGIS